MVLFYNFHSNFIYWRRNDPTLLLRMYTKYISTQHEKSWKFSRHHINEYSKYKIKYGERSATSHPVISGFQAERSIQWQINCIDLQWAKCILTWAFGLVETLAWESNADKVTLTTYISISRCLHAKWGEYFNSYVLFLEDPFLASRELISKAGNDLLDSASKEFSCEQKPRFFAFSPSSPFRLQIRKVMRRRKKFN